MSLVLAKNAKSVLSNTIVSDLALTPTGVDDWQGFAMWLLSVFSMLVNVFASLKLL